jgi:hypothetical protein
MSTSFYNFNFISNFLFDVLTTQSKANLILVHKNLTLSETKGEVLLIFSIVAHNTKVREYVFEQI